MFYSDIFSMSFSLVSEFLTENINKILPALAVFSVTILILGKLYYKIRVKFPAKVNCWFCNRNTSVPFNSSNSWYCPHCDQYNGFCSDGSYNRILTEQFCNKLNFGSWCVKTKQKSSNTNGLCRFCNINLELKVRQLAQFVPLNQENYDEEVSLYSEQLERVYRLCSRCQGVLEKTLAKKQELYVNNIQQPFKPILTNNTNIQIAAKRRHPIYLAASSILAISLLLSAIPSSWLEELASVHPSADQINQLLKPILTAVPHQKITWLGIGVQLIDCVYMRDITSLVNLFLWLILLAMPFAPVKVDHLIFIVQTLASIVFLMTSFTESRNIKPKTVTGDKPVQLQKLDTKPKSPKLPDTLPTNVPTYVSDPTIPVSPPPSTAESTPEDLGLGKLNVSSRRVTRSQTKPFQAKNYTGAKQSELFRPKPVNLSPPKLLLEKHFEYQAPLTRSSSQSSGFASLSHQKEFEEDDPVLESVSQCGLSQGVLTPYHSPFPSPVPFSQFGPFSQFPPYTLMHFTPPPFDKMYPCANMSYFEPSLNLSSSTLMSQRTHEIGWFQSLKNGLSSLLFLFLITSNIAILWKVFGEEYFKVKT